MSVRSLSVAPRQVTFASYGHILTNTAIWSPDGQWIVYDVRSDPAGSVFDGTRIERVHIASGHVEILFECHQGASCGVVTYHPTREEVVFILGPERPTPDWHYSACHRRGVVVETKRPGRVHNLDARDLTPPFTPGALRGGSHVHVFSADGKFVSFTYEDHVLEEVAGKEDAERNQRNVGVSLVGKPVNVPKTHPRNHDGTAYSVLVTKTVNHPPPGSDEISRAYEDAWVGTHGYLRADGSRQIHALAFLGEVLNDQQCLITELFIVDLPDDISAADIKPLTGTATRRPAPPLGTAQRRITFTADRQYPGIQGPRHWPRSSANGSRIALLIRDNAGHVQLWTISPLGTELRQITRYPFDVASAFSWHPDNKHMTHLADGSVWIVNTDTDDSQRLTAPAASSSLPRPEACVFSPDGSQIAYLQPVVRDGATWNQIFVVDSGLT
jgi:hypothetical protein